MFATTLGMDNLDCTKMSSPLKIHSLYTGGAHSRVEASITSPTSAPYLGKKTHGSVPHTKTLLLPSLLRCTNNEILRILVKAQPSTRSTGPRSPTRLGIRSQDLALPIKYSLGHRGLSAASGRKLTFTMKGTEVPNPRRSSTCDCTCVLT